MAPRPYSVNVTLAERDFERIVAMKTSTVRSLTGSALALLRDGLSLGRPVKVTSLDANGVRTTTTLGKSVADGPTKTLTIYLDDETRRLVDSFKQRFDTRTRARAVRMLICAGMHKAQVRR